MRRKEKKMSMERLFRNRVRNTETPESNMEPVNDMPKTHDYGIDSVSLFLMTNDYGWSDPYEHKKVILTNVEDCRNKLHAYALACSWRETGHAEWEAIMAFWFTNAVIEALEKGESEADITHIFNRDYTARGDRVFTMEQVYNHLIPWFDIVEETDDVLKLKLHI